jgi:membrane protease YdiL (CAAX protease family)
MLRRAHLLAKRYRSLPAWLHFLLFAASAAVAAIAGAVFFLIPLTFGLLLLQGSPPDSLGLSFSGRRILQFAGGLVLGSVMVAAVCLLFRLATEFQWERNEQVTSTVLLTGVWFYLKSSVFEELAFRGYGFQRLVESVGFPGAQTITAFLFAIYHVANVGMPLAAALLITGLGSLLFGYAFFRSGGVMLPIGMHAAWNFWQEQLAASSGRGQPGLWRVVRDPDSELSFIASYGILLLTTLAAMLVIRWSTGPRVVPNEVTGAE